MQAHIKKSCFIFLLALLPAFSVHALNYYWVGDGGSWTQFSSHWATTSGGNTFHTQAPGINDDVYFDVNSFSAPGEIVSIPYVQAVCRSMNWTGVAYPVSFTGSSPTGDMLVYGSFVLTPLVHWNFMGIVSLEATTAGNSLAAPVTPMLGQLQLNGIGEWTLTDSLNADLLTIANGSLYTNNFPVRSSEFIIVPGTAYVDAGSSTIQMTEHILFTGAPTNQLDADSALIIFSNNAFGQGLFNGRNGVYGRVEFDVFTPGIVNDSNTIRTLLFRDASTLNGSNTIDSLFYAHDAWPNFIGAGEVQTIIDTLDANGDCNITVYLFSTMNGQQGTISKATGTLTVSKVFMQDIHATGGAVFTSVDAIGTYSNVSGWNVNVLGSGTRYWVGGTGNWNDQSHWSHTSGGVGGACIPTSNDDVFFDAASGLGAGQTLTINTMVMCRNMDWAGTTGNPTVVFNTGFIRCWGSVTLSGDMTMGGVIEFYSTQSGNTITTNGTSINNLVFYGSGEWTLMDSLTCTQVLVSAGTFNTNNNAIECLNGSFGANNGATVNLGSSEITAGGWGVQTFTNLNAASSTINVVGSIGSFFGAGHHYHFVNCSAYSCGYTCHGSADRLKVTSTIFSVTYEETFDTLILASPNGGIYLPGDSVITVNEALLGGGLPGQPMDLYGNPAGTLSYIFMSAGDTACLDYTDFRDNAGLGGGVFYAGANSSNLGNVGGWNFYPCGTPLAAENISEGNAVTIFPNPTSGQTDLFLPTGSACVAVQDALGNTVFTKNISDAHSTLDLSALAPGIYIVRIEHSNGNVSSQQLIRQ